MDEFGECTICSALAPFKWQCDELSELAFSEWSDWLACSENCDVGVTTRTRTCTSNGNGVCPAPGTCDQPTTCLYEEKACQIKKCVTCANYPDFCDNQVNTECVDVTSSDGQITVITLVKVQSITVSLVLGTLSRIFHV